MMQTRTQKVRQSAVSVPLQGVYNLPNCGTNDDDPEDQPTAMCLTMQALIARGAYLPVVRDHLVQAQFFKVRFFLDPQLAVLLAGSDALVHSKRDLAWHQEVVTFFIRFWQVKRRVEGTRKAWSCPCLVRLGRGAWGCSAGPLAPGGVPGQQPVPAGHQQRARHQKRHLRGLPGLPGAISAVPLPERVHRCAPRQVCCRPSGRFPSSLLPL